MGVVLVGGVLAGALYWWVGGWWCRVRLRWSGAAAPDQRLARLLLVYSSFVFAGPAVFSLVGQTFLYPNYLVAYEAEYILSSVVFVMVFWSLFTTYKGARVLFTVSRGRARLWFIVLPAVFYLFVLGGIGVLLGMAA